LQQYSTHGSTLGGVFTVAQLIQAVARFGPRLITGRTAQLDDVAQWLANGSGLTKSQVLSVLYNMQAVILFFNQFGSAVKLPGIGTFTPTVGSDGRIRVSLREAPELRNALNAEGAFRGEIANRSNVGTNVLGYKALWDAMFPDDPLEVGPPLPAAIPSAATGGAMGAKPPAANGNGSTTTE
jgi:hypothetical protein